MKSLLAELPRSTGFLFRVPAGIKLGVALLLIIATALQRQAAWPFFAAAFAALFMLAVTSRLPLSALGRRVLLFEPFVLGVAMLTLFQPEGWRLFLLLAARSNICLMTMILLAATTPFTDLLRVLRRLRVPSLLLTTLALAYRYTSVLITELDRMRRARAARSYSRRHARLWSGLAVLIALLFVRSSLRAERVFAAMCARGWNP